MLGGNATGSHRCRRPGQSYAGEQNKHDDDAAEQRSPRHDLDLAHTTAPGTPNGASGANGEQTRHLVQNEPEETGDGLARVGAAVGRSDDVIGLLAL